MKFRLRLGAIAVLLLFPGAALAHRLDEYLQATRLSLAPDRVVLKIDLTPGVEVAPAIFAMITPNRDGRISEAEGISRADLPSDEAAASAAYLRQMLAQQNGWKQSDAPIRSARRAEGG